MKRIINGFEVDWASELVFAEQQTAPNYGYLFEVSADRKRIVRCAHISIGRDSDSPDGNAERLEKTQGKPLRSSYASSARVNRGASRRAVLSSPGLAPPQDQKKSLSDYVPIFHRLTFGRPLPHELAPRGEADPVC